MKLKRDAELSTAAKDGYKVHQGNDVLARVFELLVLDCCNNKKEKQKQDKCDNQAEDHG